MRTHPGLSIIVRGCLMALLAGAISQARDVAGPKERRLEIMAGAVGKDGAGKTDGPALQARFRSPTGLALDHRGRLYISDSVNYRLRRLADGQVETLVGLWGHPQHDPGERPPGYVQPLCFPSQIAWHEGALYIADSQQMRIARWTEQGGLETLIGEPNQAGLQDGPREKARLSYPWGLDVTKDGTIYWTEVGNNVIRGLKQDGAVFLLAGRKEPGFKDGKEGAQAQFRDLRGLTVGPDGWLYVCDSGNHAIRKVSPEDGATITVAGGEEGQGKADGVGADAQFAGPCGLDFGPDGAIYVADWGNHAIRRVTVDGAVTHVTTVVAGEAGLPHPVAVLFHGSRILVAVEHAIVALELAGAKATVERKN